MTQAGVKLHLTEHLKEHLLLLLALVGANPQQHHWEELYCQVTGIKQDLCKAEAKLQDHTWALTTHYGWLAKLGDDVKRLFEALAQVQDVCGMVAALQQENTELKHRVEALEARAAPLEALAAALEARAAALEARADIHDDHNNRINIQVESQRAIQCSLLRRFQENIYQSEVQCIGDLVWIISDVTRKYAEARGNRELFLTSPPYTSRSGYKVCIRLYMNGYGREWNANMSFFLVLMKGSYDAILEWPFSRRVEFRVMGQGNRRGHDLVVDFRPDPQSAAFARPVRGMNIADGVPQCAFPLEILRRDGYVDDDTMFVKVVVGDK